MFLKRFKLCAVLMSGRGRKDSRFTVPESAQSELHNAETRERRTPRSEHWKRPSQDSVLEEQQERLSNARLGCVLELLW